jgi:hypothetical protein
MQSNDPGDADCDDAAQGILSTLLPLVIPSEAAVPQRGTMPTRNPEHANRDHAATGNFCDKFPPCRSEPSEEPDIESPVETTP